MLDFCTFYCIIVFVVLYILLLL